MQRISLPQIVSAGIYNAQIAIKNRTVSPNRKTTMFEIELPIGEGGISYIDDESHLISESTVICAKPGQIRHTRLPFMCYYVHMIVTEGDLLDILISLPNYIENVKSDELRDIFASICAHYGAGTLNDEIMLQSLILKLVCTLNKTSPLQTSKYTPKSNNHEVIEHTLRYINENLSSSLTLEGLASEAKFSPIYFHRLFKSSTGKTLHEYIEDQRIKKALNLLLSTDMTLAQISYECGFSSQSYFSYAFKRRTGLTPRKCAKAAVERYDDKVQ